jgi:hypothetical protein
MEYVGKQGKNNASICHELGVVSCKMQEENFVSWEELTAEVHEDEQQLQTQQEQYSNRPQDKSRKHAVGFRCWCKKRKYSQAFSHASEYHLKSKEQWQSGCKC